MLVRPPSEPPMDIPEAAAEPPRIRPVSRSNAQQPLRTLKCFPQVHERVIAGWTLGEVAKFVQEDQKEYLGISRAKLIEVLKDYRRSLPPDQMLSRRMPQVMDQAKDKIAKGLDELAELERLYRLQMERIEIDFSAERKIKKLFSTMAPEIAEARKLLNNIASIKMDLGISKRNLGTLNIDAAFVGELSARCGNERVGAVLQDPQKRHRVLGLAQRLLGLGVRDLSVVDSEGEEVPEPDVPEELEPGEIESMGDPVEPAP